MTGPRLGRRGFLTAAAVASGSVAGSVAGSVVGASPAGASLDLVSVRSRFFGRDNVDQLTGRVRPDRVILSWFGVTGFAMALGGRVVLLDAWVPRGQYSGYVPTSPAELAALRPSHVVLGHAHWDHAADAAEIALASGAIVVGTPEHCAQISAQAGRPIRTLPLGAAGAPVGTSSRWALGRARVITVRHPHSAPKAPTGDEAPILPGLDLAPCLEHPPTLADSLHELSHLADQEGGVLLHRFDLGGFRLVWHDSSGPLREDAPDLLDRFAGWRRTDVQLGSIQGFGQYTNGLRDPMDYVRALRPRVFVPTHHDNWAPGITASASTYRSALETSLGRLPAARRPELRLLEDPRDYVRPSLLTFRI